MCYFQFKYRFLSNIKENSYLAEILEGVFRLFTHKTEVLRSRNFHFTLQTMGEINAKKNHDVTRINAKN